MTNAPVNPGDLLAGKYRIVRVLGAGGIGVVVEAHHIQLDRTVAIKFLRPEANQTPEVVERFTREARSSARLKGEHVTQVLDVGALEDGSPYMVMEHLAGTDLGQIVAQRGRLPIVEAVDYVLQACEAVAEAHGARIVHRDLKPANLFLTRTADGEPLVKVLDFGISKALDPERGEAGLSLTGTATMIGTPLYMSPEQMRNARGVDVRTDIWALGAILYELISGRPPFMASSLAELCIQVMQEAPVPLPRLRPDVPPGLVEIIDQCLSKARADRYPDVTGLARALATYGGDLAQSRVTRVARLATRPSSVDEVPRTVPSDSGLGTTPDPSVHTPTARSAPDLWPGTSTVRSWGSASLDSSPKKRLYRRAAWVGAGLFVVGGLGTGLWTLVSSMNRSSNALVQSASAPLSALALDSGHAKTTEPPKPLPPPSVQLPTAPSSAEAAPSILPAKPVIAAKTVRTAAPTPRTAEPKAAPPAPAKPSRDRLLNDRE